MALRSFLGIGAGRRARRGARAETEDEMRTRHARELHGAGYAETEKDRDDEQEGGHEADEELDKERKKKRRDEQEGGHEADDELDKKRERDGTQGAADLPPPDIDPDPDADPAEPLPDDGDDDDDEDLRAAREDEAVDREPDEDVRRAKRARLRRRRRTAARHAERARCAAIFQSAAATKNVALAAELAFNTGLSSARAVAVLTRGVAAGSSLGARMQAIGPSGVGPGEPHARLAARSVASTWDRHLQAVHRF